jgi:hypothetical protein
MLLLVWFYLRGVRLLTGKVFLVRFLTTVHFLHRGLFYLETDKASSYGNHQSTHSLL